MPDFFGELNPEQLDAVVNGDGPCLVLAGAGSGKTRVITYRVAYLLEQGVNPENILLVTFTNKAAGEMVRRVGALSSRAEPQAESRDPLSSVRGIPPLPASGRVGRNDNANNGIAAPASRARNDTPVKLPWAGTFHHIAYKILRMRAGLLGYAPNFTILDSDDSEALIKMCAKGLKCDQVGRKFPSAGILQNIISFARNAEIAVDEVLDMKYPQWLDIAETIKFIADNYAQRKKEANAMDFDDLLVNFLLLLSMSFPRKRESSQDVIPAKAGILSAERDSSFRWNDNLGHGDDRNILEKYSCQFKYILVDEYQDTNKIQASIIDRLASAHKNIFVVGDDAQSIYSFRAADIANILSFEKKYPDAKIFRLETNYRSSQEILDLANSVISNNAKQYKKVLKTLESTGVRPELHPRMDQIAEAEFVADKIAGLLDDGVPRKEIAVLFRAAHHSQMLEMQLMRRGIAYDYRGGLRFFERAHVKDVLSYLRVMNNLADTAAWLRILMHEDGIGPAGAQKIIEAIKQAAVIPAKAGILSAEKDSSFRWNDSCEQIKSVGQNVLGERGRAGWNNFLKIWNELARDKKQEPADMIRVILGSRYAEYLESEYMDAEERMKDLEQLAVFAEKYGDLGEFLSEAALQESFNLRGQTPPLAPPQRGGDIKGKIILSTIHQAKGLEWHSVFLLNLSSGGFPNDRAMRERDGLEEERRLFYVAITRAKRNLTLTYPMASGGAGDFLSGPSLFLSEISDGLLDDHSLLSANSTALDDEDADVHYIPEGRPLKLKPGSFLRDVDDF